MSEKQLENEISDKQKDSDKNFFGRQHYISSLPDLRSDQKIVIFWVDSISEKSATN